MFTTLITTLVTSGLVSTPAVTAPAVLSDPPVRLWINKDRQFLPGDAVQVQVETGATGHLFVLRFDPDGQLRVMFPVRPGDDAFVNAGRRYEVRDAGQGQSFLASGNGPALVYAALSQDPLRFDGYVTENGEWDYDRLFIPRDAEDPEAAMTALVQSMATARGFDYDVLDYTVYAPASSQVYVESGSGVDVYLGFGFGWYGGYWGGWWGPGYPGWWLGWGYPCCGGYYPPYYPGYYPPYYPGYYPPVYPYPHYNYPYVVGRPRGYVIDTYGRGYDGRPRVENHGREGTRGPNVGRQVSQPDGNTPARRTRPRPDARPSGNDTRSAQPGRSTTEGRSTPVRSNGGEATRARPRGADGSARSRGNDAATNTNRTAVETPRPNFTPDRARGSTLNVPEGIRGGTGVPASRARTFEVTRDGPREIVPSQANRAATRSVATGSSRARATNSASSPQVVSRSAIAPARRVTPSSGYRPVVRSRGDVSPRSSSARGVASSRGAVAPRGSSAARPTARAAPSRAPTRATSRPSAPSSARAAPSRGAPSRGAPSRGSGGRGRPR